jgi:hypothetical protein
MPTIARQMEVGENGKPAAALIPWEVFVGSQEPNSGQHPNETTLAAMDEASEGLPRLGLVADLMADLNA